MICWCSKREYIRLVAAVKRLRAERNYYKRVAKELEKNLLDAIYEKEKQEDDLK